MEPKNIGGNRNIIFDNPMKNMRVSDVEEKYGINDVAFMEFLKAYDLEYHGSAVFGWEVDDSLINSYVRLYYDIQAEAAKRELENDAYKETHTKMAFDERKRVSDILAQKKATDFPVFEINGSRGRSIKVYRDRCVIKTDATLGAILTDNATDGEKTIFYKNVLGIQYKAPGLTLGYLQLETGSNQMNNSKSNMFSENTFTFERDIELVEEMRDYIIYQVSLFNQLDS